MKTSTKWILGILIGLFVIAVVAGAGLLVFARWNVNGWMMGTPFGDGRGTPWQQMPRHMPMYPGYGLEQNFWSSPLRLIGMGLLCLGVLALLALVVIVVVRSLNRPAQPTSAAVQPAVSAPAQVTPPACPSCGRAVQADWSHCPYCGSDLAAHREPDNP